MQRLKYEETRFSDWANLLLEQATLAEANRVDRIAREKLGMKFPEAGDIVVVRP